LRRIPAPVVLQVGPDDTGETRRRKHRAAYAFYVMVALVAAGVALVVWVFPTKTFLSQRQATADINTKLAVLDDKAAELQRQVIALDSDAEIEQVARARYNLVFPGEKAFVVLPASLPTFPSTPGYNVVKAFFTVKH
jgi:cell division protein FtsB